MRITIFGAGAVGCHFAVRLGLGGNEVSVVVRGAQLAAITRSGLTLEFGAETLRFSAKASDNAAELGKQDLVIVTLKAHAQPAAAKAIRELLATDTPVIFAQNGIPWWLPHACANRTAGTTKVGTWPDLGFLDPDGELLSQVGLARTLGGVVTSANSIVAPGIVRADPPRRPQLAIGEIHGARSARVDRIRAVLEDSGIGSPAVADISSEIWGKLVRNLSASSLALLTERNSSIVQEDAAVGDISSALIAEIESIAQAGGFDTGGMSARAIELLKQAPSRFPSLLQDRLAGRRLETDSLFKAPQTMARALGVKTPVFDIITALVIALSDR